MGSSRWKVAAAAFLAIVVSLLPVDADEHEHTVRRRLERPIEKGGALKIMDVCNLLAVAATANLHTRKQPRGRDRVHGSACWGYVSIPGGLPDRCSGL